MLKAQFNLPPVAVSTEEQYFASSPLQCSLHLLNAAGEAELLYAAGTQNTLPCVHPESVPYRKKTIIMKIASTDSGPLYSI